MAAQPREAPKWVTTWGCAHRNLRGLVQPGACAFSVSFPNNVAGVALRVRLGNLYGRTSTRVAACNVTIDRTEVELSPGAGARELVVPPGGDAYSAAHECDLPAGSTIAVRVTLPPGEAPASGNGFPDGSILALVQGLEILTADDVNVAACFGDSITHRGTWTDPLRDRLYRAFPGGISLLEVGVNGNRLTGDSANMTRGMSGLRRFPHDILRIAGLTHVIFALGSNDIGHPCAKEWVPLSEMPTLASYAEAVSLIRDALHARGVKLIGATMTPRSWSGERTDDRESLRREINDWILHGGAFDETLDFSTLLAQQGVAGLPPAFDSGDGLHISATAGARLAEHIPLEFFADCR